ncbi:MAG: DUF481 domain-containing protein [Flavobacteriaceae bacterium]|nr:DUF481 domain-containing protein [Flavobacteriaceae bacterium]
MKSKIVALFLLFNFYSFSQSSIVNTERNFHRIDSVFHVFSDFMFDIKKGNIDMTILRSNITLGSKFGNNLFRLTGAYNENNLNDKKVIKNVSYQIRYNRMHLDNNSFFFFIQNGEDFRTFIDQRFLIGSGYRIHIFRKKSNYFDVATGLMREYEKYPSYTHQGESYNSSSAKRTRFTFNIFSSLNLSKNIKSHITLYSQFNTKTFNDYRIFVNQNFRFIVNKNFSTFFRIFINEPSVKYVKKVKYNSDLIFGFSINI